jgi:lisH domain-containing protein FOPNL
MQSKIETGEDLVNAVKEALNRRGVISSLKARIRAEVFHALEDKSIPPPQRPNDVYIANEIIRDFLITMKLDSTLSVLSEEIGQSAEVPVNRELIGGEIGLNTISCDKNTPLLMLLIQHFIKQKQASMLEDMRPTDLEHSTS